MDAGVTAFIYGETADMLWNRARRSDNVNDTREGKEARKITGKQTFVALAITATLGGAGVYSTLDTTSNNLSITPSSQTLDDPQLQFVQSILGDTEDTWAQLFSQSAQRYPLPTLTLYSNSVNSACGFAGSSAGPFYCPQDQRIYLDLEFFRIMGEQHAVIGEFAQAYVLAHEVGHHVQLELGMSDPFEQALNHGQRVTGDGGLEVRAELQADCLAGVWAHHAQRRLDWLEPGDIDAALNAAATFGDDSLQRSANRTVRPETFNHGTSQQRTNWFKAGFTSGKIDTCDTFNAEEL